MQLKISHFSLFVLAPLTCIATALAMEEFDLKIPLGLIKPNIPKDNLLTQEKIDLGKKLFFDQSFSFNGKVSCATCHMPEHGFSDVTAIGFTSAGGALQRNTPTIVNAALNNFQFWDGRAASLEAQVADVARPGGDTSIHINTAIKTVKASKEYTAAFEKVFNGPPTPENFCQAISAYERTVLSGDTRFDRFLFKGDQDALTPVEKKGFAIFMGKGNCAVCHTVIQKSDNNSGYATFIDQKFHNLGVGAYGTRMKDAGRYLVTGERSDFGAFKTPTLRNVSLTSPYMHDGSLPTLEAVVEFYNRGGNPNKGLDPQIKPLHLTGAEKQQLVAFIKTLTDEKLAKIYVPVPKLEQKIRRLLAE